MRKKGSLFTEAALLAAIGLVFSLVANALSPRGLSLTRHYFANSPRAEAVLPATSLSTNPAASTIDPSAELKARLAAKGLSLIDGAEVEKLFRDPQYEQELIIFVDARDDRHYEEGHIPGAYQFDRYYPEKYLPNVLPPCLTASRIVVYCTGGKCEDSEFAAVALTEAGVPPGNLLVYEGGITDWLKRKLPTELGPRKSGNIKTP